MSILGTETRLKRAVAAIQPYHARKGDICAIEQRHSSYSTMFAADRWSTWHIGRVESATRDGVIKSASAELSTESGKPFPMTFREYDRAATAGWVALSIADPAMRTAAATLCGREFKSSDSLRDAIRGAAGMVTA